MSGRKYVLIKQEIWNHKQTLKKLEIGICEKNVCWKYRTKNVLLFGQKVSGKASRCNISQAVIASKVYNEVFLWQLKYEQKMDEWKLSAKT